MKMKRAPMGALFRGLDLPSQLFLALGLRAGVAFFAAGLAAAFRAGVAFFAAGLAAALRAGAAFFAAGLDAALRCLLYTSPSPRDLSTSRMPSSA